jgi:hypothetical protein
MIPEPKRWKSYGEERAFFHWLEWIPGVASVVGTPDGLEVNFDKPIDSEALRELVVLMRRYNLDMSCLRDLCLTIDDDWFRDKKTYFYKAVFGRPNDEADSARKPE